MQNTNAKNRDKIFLFVGRLEKEKGIDILLKILDDKRNQKGNWQWHIFWDGSFLEDLKKRENEKIFVHGQVDSKTLNTFFTKANLTFMPSRFLETFGLVALESLSCGTPVCGFKKGGLEDMIPPSLALDEKNPVESFFEIVKNADFELENTEKFSYENWLKNLENLVKNHKKILLVSDYKTHVGGAETYTTNLKKSLENLGKTVKIVGYEKEISPLMRKFLFILSPFAFWRGRALQKEIEKFNPDLIWCGTIMRYFWPWGVKTIAKNRNIKKYITHHDIGLICKSPSKIYDENQIPKSLKLSDWIRRERNIFSILITTGKWLYIRWIWKYISHFDTHLAPAKWLQNHLPKNISVQVFPHTIFKEENIK